MNITGGKYNGRKINSPDEKVVRPTLSKVRMSVFNTLYSILGDFENKSFLDMFAGSGIMGLEALSRGFKRVVALEKNKKVAEIIKTNYSLLGVTSELYIGDSIRTAKNLTDSFDVVYIDPPYASGIYKSALESAPHFYIAVLEHNVELDFSDYEIIKQKKYGDKYITFITEKTSENRL